MIPFSSCFSCVLSASESSGEERLSFPEKTSPGAFLKAVRVSGKETKDSKGKRKERKNPAGKRRSGLPRKVWTQAQTHGQYGYKKSPEAFLPQDFC